MTDQHTEADAERFRAMAAAILSKDEVFRDIYIATICQPGADTLEGLRAAIDVARAASEADKTRKAAL